MKKKVAKLTTKRSVALTPNQIVNSIKGMNLPKGTNVDILVNAMDKIASGECNLKEIKDVVNESLKEVKRNIKTEDKTALSQMADDLCDGELNRMKLWLEEEKEEKNKEKYKRLEAENAAHSLSQANSKLEAEKTALILENEKLLKIIEEQKKKLKVLKSELEPPF